MHDRYYGKLKLIMFVLMFIFLFGIYCTTIPLNNIHNKSYTLHFGNIIYSFTILVSILLMQFENYSKKDWIIAISLGVISVGITVPINISGIICSICVVSTYLASKSLYGEYSTRMELFNAKCFKDILKDLKYVLVIISFFIVIKMYSLIVSGLSIKFIFSPSIIFTSLGAAVSEEIIFRLFLFSVIVNISKGKVKSNVLAIIAMVIPFGISHFVEIGIYKGVFSALVMPMGFVVTCVILTMLALKRNVFSAILFHFLYGLLIGLIIGV